MTTAKKIQITLSDRRPVNIVADDWDVIAEAKWHSGQYASQANEVAWIRVRQHDDGRCIVYCSRDRGPGGMAIGYRGKEGGFILPGQGSVDYPAQSHTDEIVRAIRRCAGLIDKDELGDECIAALPAEDLA